MKFSSDVAGWITGIRFYKGAGTAAPMSPTSGAAPAKLLASATFTSETASGWQQVNFAKPVAISANTTYVASYFAPAGHYAGDTGYFSSGYSSGPLHVPANGGVYVYGSQGGFPSQTWKASNYWVDSLFTTTAGTTTSVVPNVTPTVTPPTVTGETPAPNAAGVATTALPTAEWTASVPLGTTLTVMMSTSDDGVWPGNLSHGEADWSCAEHVRQPGGASPLHNLMEVKC